MKLQIDTRQRPDGKLYIHWPFISISDIHWGTRQSRAKRFSSMAEHTEADQWHLIGDLADGEYLMTKPTWNMGPWHRQGQAHMFRKANKGSRVVDYKGNHETGDHFARLEGKSLYGIELEIEQDYHDPKGRLVHMEHGDRFDKELYESPEQQEMAYKWGSRLLDAAYGIDQGIRFFRPETEFSIAVSGKHLVKEQILARLGVRELIHNELDESDAQIFIYGHTHMAGFERTPKGKLVINDGTCTEHVQACVHDRFGNWGLIQWHKDKMLVWEPDTDPKHPHVVRWEDLGLQHFSNEPTFYDDLYTDQADRFLRLVARAYPAVDRQEALEQRRMAEEILENGVHPQVSENFLLQLEFHRALNNPALQIPVPRPDISEDQYVEDPHPEPVLVA